MKLEKEAENKPKASKIKINNKYKCRNQYNRKQENNRGKKLESQWIKNWLFDKPLTSKREHKWLIIDPEERITTTDHTGMGRMLGEIL